MVVENWIKIEMAIGNIHDNFVTNCECVVSRSGLTHSRVVASSHNLNLHRD